MGNITITLSENKKVFKIQGTCQGLNKKDVLKMLKKLKQEVKKTNLMEGLHRKNGGYFDSSYSVK